MARSDQKEAYMRVKAEFCKYCGNPIAYDAQFKEYYHLDTGLYGCPGLSTPVAVATPGGKARAQGA